MLGALLAVTLSQAAATPPGAPPPAQLQAPATQCEGCSLTPKEAASPKVHLLERRIRDLDLRIASVNEAWPQSSVVLMFAGVSFGPLMTVLGGVMVALGAAAIPALLVPGIVVLVVGVIGVAMLVWGAMQASKSSATARAEKEALIKERTALEAELDAQPQATRAVNSVPLFAVEF